MNSDRAINFNGIAEVNCGFYWSELHSSLSLLPIYVRLRGLPPRLLPLKTPFGNLQLHLLARHTIAFGVHNTIALDLIKVQLSQLPIVEGVVNLLDFSELRSQVVRLKVKLDDCQGKVDQEEGADQDHRDKVKNDVWREGEGDCSLDVCPSL